MQFDRAADLCDEAMRQLTEIDGADRAALLVREAVFRGHRESAVVGLELLDEALVIYATLPRSAEYVRALEAQIFFLDQLGRFDDAYRVAKLAVEAAAQVGSPRQRRRILAWLAWQEAEAGDLARALHTADEAHALAAPGSDPLGDLMVGVIWTDILLRSGGSAEKVTAAGEPALAVAAACGDRQLGSRHVAVEHLRSTDPRRFRQPGLPALIDPVTERPSTPTDGPSHLERVNLDALRGRLDAAHDRLSPLLDDEASLLYRGSIETRSYLANYAAVVDLWRGSPERALSSLRRLLDDCVGSISMQVASLLGLSFVLAARAAADLGGHDPQAGRLRAAHLRDLTELKARAAVDPFSTTTPADVPALAAGWQAETARLAGQPSLELWAMAAGEWDKLSRPHDAAYCRWRGAQVALATDQGTIALRLLRRAAREAREHVPLSTAIAETTEKARRTAQPS